MTDSVLRTVVRRETHSPRTAAMLVVVVLLVSAAIYAGVEIGLSLADRGPLLIAPGVAFDALRALPTTAAPVALIGAGVLVALLGLVLLVLAVAPGRLSKHEMTWGERAVVVDNGVVAAALAQHLSTESGIARDNVLVGVAHRTVDVTVRPTLGIPVDVDELRRIIEVEVASYNLTPAVRTVVRVDARKEEVR